MLDVSLAIIADLLDDFLLVVAGFIARKAAKQPAMPFGIRGDLNTVIPHGSDRGPSGQNSGIPLSLRQFKHSGHPL